MFCARGPAVRVACDWQVRPHGDHSNGCSSAAESAREDAGAADAVPGSRAPVPHLQPGVGGSQANRCALTAHMYPHVMSQTLAL